MHVMLHGDAAASASPTFRFRNSYSGNWIATCATPSIVGPSPLNHT